MSLSVPLAFVALPHFKGLELPKYETSGSAGMDVRAAIPEDEPLTLNPGERFAVPTGLTLAIPFGYEMQVRPRSGLAFKYGISCANAPGTIDSDYRGELKILLVNHGQHTFEVTRGERIAQLLIAPVIQGVWHEVEELPETARGVAGFGSTGTK